jgi:hypothetical protein
MVPAGNVSTTVVMAVRSVRFKHNIVRFETSQFTYSRTAYMLLSYAGPGGYSAPFLVTSATTEYCGRYKGMSNGWSSIERTQHSQISGNMETPYKGKACLVIVVTGRSPGVAFGSD